MPTGDKTFKGLAVPLSGEFELKHETLATDFMTMTGVASMSGDFLVLRNSDLTELCVIDSDGAFEGLSISGASRGVTFTSIATTAASTGIAKGEIFVMETSTFVQLAVGQTANSLRYLNTTSA